jgi:hypothetical protein
MATQRRKVAGTRKKASSGRQKASRSQAIATKRVTGARRKTGSRAKRAAVRLPARPPLERLQRESLEAGERCFPEIPAPKKRAYLAAYSVTANIVQACRMADIDPKTPYNWLRQKDEAYLAAWEAARSIAGDVLEAEAVRRAHEGVDRPVYQQGRLVGYERVYSDTLLIFLLKGMRPEVYRERHELMGKDGGPIAFQFAQFIEEAYARRQQAQLVEAETVEADNGDET